MQYLPYLMIDPAKLDQLMRDDALPSEQAESLNDALGRAAEVV